MPGTMPYHLEKGPYFSILEDYCNSSATNVKKALRQLRRGDPIPEVAGLFNPNSLTAGPSASQVKRHMYEDWFGFGYNAATQKGVPPQPALNPPATRTTGYWTEYYGNVEGIVRETLVRTCEVILGLDHEQPIPPGRPPRHLRLEAFWKCGQPWWEGWVTWHLHPTPSNQRPRGQVTLILATPGTGDPVLSDPTKGRTSADFKVNPTNTRTSQGKERHHGMWVVTHEDHEMLPLLTTAPSEVGDWVYPTFTATFRGVGDVVVVQPSEADGGVLAEGRPFVP